MSILAQKKYSSYQNPEDSPKCPNAPKFKPFSSVSTLEDECDLFEQINSIDQKTFDSQLNNSPLKKSIKCKNQCFNFLNKRSKKEKTNFTSDFIYYFLHFLIKSSQYKPFKTI